MLKNVHRALFFVTLISHAADTTHDLRALHNLSLKSPVEQDWLHKLPTQKQISPLSERIQQQEQLVKKLIGAYKIKPISK